MFVIESVRLLVVVNLYEQEAWDAVLRAAGDMFLASGRVFGFCSERSIVWVKRLLLDFDVDCWFMYLYTSALY